MSARTWGFKSPLAHPGFFAYGWSCSCSASLVDDVASGRVVITQPGGAVVTFTKGSSRYTAAGFVLATLVHNANGTWPTFTTNAAGEMTSLAYYAPCPAAPSRPPIAPPSSPLATRLGRAASCQPLYQRSYSYDAGSELTTMQSSPPGPLGPSISASFTYDGSGERTGETIAPAVPKAPKVPGLPGPPSAPPLASLSYGYDAPGEMTTYAGPVGGSALFLGGPTPLHLGGLATTGTKVSSTYTYDPSGLLASETATTTSPPGLRCMPIVPAKGSPGPLGPPSPTRSTTGCSSSVTTAFTWETASSTPLALGVGSYYYVYGPGGLPLEQIGPKGSVLYYLANRQGSTVALADEQGHVVARYAYGPYGSLACGPGTSLGLSSACSPGVSKAPSCGARPAAPHGATPGQRPCLADAIAANRFLYDGQYLDVASGLYYLRARWYDPATAQFTSVDPLVAKTLQPYEYAGDDPVHGGDPSGMCGCSVGMQFASTFAETTAIALATVATGTFFLGAALGPLGALTDIVVLDVASQALITSSALFASMAAGEGLIGIGACPTNSNF